MKAPQTVVLANPHCLGDVVMMLPLAGAMRRHWPGVRLIFAGRQPALTQACEFFDEVINSEDILADPALLKRLKADVFLNPFSCDNLARAAFAARVPVRVGNLLRRRSAAFCNRFVAYGSTEHGHMLGYAMRHVHALGVPPRPWPSDPRELFGLTRVGALSEQLKRLLDPSRFNLILHTHSGGSGREWPLRHFLELAQALGKTDRFKLFLTGSQRERQVIERDCPELLQGELATDIMGALSGEHLLAFIQAADGLLASGTGPLHVAGALGRHALGIYATGANLDPRAWRPLGPHARTISMPGTCKPGSSSCPKKTGPPCACTRALQVDDVISRLVMPAYQQWSGERQGRELAEESIRIAV